MQTYKNWRMNTDTDQILWLFFDKKGASVNTIDSEVMEELSDILDTLANDTTHKGVVIASAKKSGFIAGADISQFNKFAGIDEAVELLKKGQHIFQKIENLKMPSVAMIEGFCLGGGMELALACRYRVVEESANTRLGLPEVKLGIHPGWGGTVRLPRLIGVTQALNLILTGSTVSGKVAAKLGMADVAVPQRQLVHAAKYYILQKPKTRQPGMLNDLLNAKFMRPLVASFMRKKLRAKVMPTQYPAPFYVIDYWERFGLTGNAAFDREAKSCGKLFFSETCQNLVRVFFLQERLKGQAKDIKYTPKHVHVIGAGTMGGDIAAWCAFQGFTVTLQDREAKYIAPAIARAYKLFSEKLKEGYLIQRTMDRLIPDVNGYGIQKADIIIEAIYENLTAKQELFKSLESQAKPQAIFATNTSSILLDQINTVLDRPERLVGIHFFNPVAKMMLVEIVHGEHTDSSIVEKATSFVRKLDKLPLQVKSSPGFLVNRILMPYLLESVNFLDEGIAAATIDQAMVDFGMPMGPIELADTVGLDVCLSVANYLAQYFNAKIPQRLIDLVNQGKLGRKTGEGFYVYKKGRQVKLPEPTSKPLEEISDRLVLRMLDESFACLREGVVADGDLLDAGMIFGTGFAPFRGGPIHYAKAKGIGELFQQYVALKKERGEKVETIKAWDADVETM